jgi:putative flippase GtrA
MTVGPRATVLRHPLTRRVVGYSAGSIVAAVIGELTFAAMFGLFHAGTTWATAAGFIGGAAPNYVLNRRWAWPDRRGRSCRAEITLYLGVIACSFAASALVTHWVEGVAVHMSPDRAWQTVLVAAAFLAVSGLFFVIKFALYEFVVFSPAAVPSSPATQGPSAVEPSGAVAPGG